MHLVHAPPPVLAPGPRLPPGAPGFVPVQSGPGIVFVPPAGASRPPRAGAGFGGFEAPGAASPRAQAPASGARAAAGKPSWVLVIPAEMDAGGKVRWGVECEWCRSWAAPARAGGIRWVSIMGDADDRDRLSGAMLSDPDDPRVREALRGLARKYGAPSVAVARRDAGDSTVGAWFLRHADAESEVVLPAEGEDPKAAALQALVALAAGSNGDLPGRDEIPEGSEPMPDRAYPADETPAPFEDGGIETSPPRISPVSSLEIARRPGGGLMARLRVRARGPADQAEALRRATLAGIAFVYARPGEGEIEIAGLWHADPRALVAALDEAFPRA